MKHDPSKARADELAQCDIVAVDRYRNRFARVELLVDAIDMYVDRAADVDERLENALSMLGEEISASKAEQARITADRNAAWSRKEEAGQ